MTGTMEVPLPGLLLKRSPTQSHLQAASGRKVSLCDFPLGVLACFLDQLEKGRAPVPGRTGAKKQENLNIRIFDIQN